MLNQRDIDTLMVLVNKELRMERRRFNNKLRQNELNDHKQGLRESYIEFLAGIHEKLRMQLSELEEEEYSQSKPLH